MTLKRRRFMDTLIIILILAGWVILQKWVLPRMGVQT